MKDEPKVGDAVVTVLRGTPYTGLTVMDVDDKVVSVLLNSKQVRLLIKALVAADSLGFAEAAPSN